MAVFVSNLVTGLERGLDRPDFLLEVVKPFGGLVGIEFFIHTYSEPYMEKMKKIPMWLESYPRAVHGPFVGVEASAAAKTKECGHFFDSYKKAWEAALMLGCRRVVVHDHERFVNPEEKAALQDRCLANLEELARQAGENGIVLLLENLALPSKGTPLFEEEEYLELFSRFPEAEALIDVGHLNLAGWDLERVLSCLGSKIRGYHLHNNDGLGDSHQRISKGVFDFKNFFKAYKKWTPAADLTLEYGDNHGITAEELKQDLEYVMKWRKEK